MRRHHLNLPIKCVDITWKTLPDKIFLTFRFSLVFASNKMHFFSGTTPKQADISEYLGSAIYILSSRLQSIWLSTALHVAELKSGI